MPVTSSVVVLAAAVSAILAREGGGPPVEAFVPGAALVTAPAMPQRTPFLLQDLGRRSTAASQSSSSSSSSSSLYSSAADMTTSSRSVDSDAGNSLERSVEELKKVLKREYASFFDPMERSWYSPMVTFEDPLTSLDGVDSYQNNVDMLSSRTLLGKFLFADAGIVLHKVEGGEVVDSGSGGGDGKTITDIITRWTLRMTVKVLPWTPTARFTGISQYQVEPGGPNGVQIVKQTDYWDSINLAEGGNTYSPVGKQIAVLDFLDQLKPDNVGNAVSASNNELPYQLLRRGKDFQVRRYPSYVAVMTKYQKREDAFAALGAFCDRVGVKQVLSPSIIEVASPTDKRMMWPLAYASPTDRDPEATLSAKAKDFSTRAGKEGIDCEVIVIPERVAAVATFSDASVEPIVRRVDSKLRDACRRDGLPLNLAGENDGLLRFAQFDAVYTMGKRRGEVWIDLDDEKHPWAS